MWEEVNFREMDLVYVTTSDSIASFVIKVFLKNRPVLIYLGTLCQR